MELLFATGNAHKMKEVSQILGDEFVLKTLKDVGFEEEIPEPFETLEENAFAKSDFIYQRYGMDCFGEDTGLEIDALDGRPGVYSARYGGEDKNADKNIDKVLKEMEGSTIRGAQFKAVINLILNGKAYEFVGVIRGTIATERMGEKGFGYDPIFIPEGFGRSFAEFSDTEKNQVSHRYRAVEKLRAFLRSL